MLTVCLASRREAADFSRAQSAAGRLKLLITGYKNRAFRREEAFGGPVMIAGFAGALNIAFVPGTIFLPSKVFSLTGPVIAPDPDLQALLKYLFIQQGLRVMEGTLVTTEDPVISSKERAELNSRGFDAVDMESHGLLKHFSAVNARVAVIRLISDQADENAKDDYQRRLKDYSSCLSRALHIAFETISDERELKCP